MDSNWKIGDIAICINTAPSSVGYLAPPLRLKAEYVVQHIYTCPKCNEMALDVGLGCLNPKGTLCCSERIPIHEIWWCFVGRFVKKQTLSKEEQIKEALAVEDYEKVIELTKN